MQTIAFLADGVEAVTEADRRRRLAFTRRGRVDGGHEDQLAIRLAALRLDEFEADIFALSWPYGQKVIFRNAKLRADLHDRQLSWRRVRFRCRT